MAWVYGTDPPCATRGKLNTAKGVKDGVLRLRACTEVSTHLVVPYENLHTALGSIKDYPRVTGNSVLKEHFRDDGDLGLCSITCPISVTLGWLFLFLKI